MRRMICRLSICVCMLIIDNAKSGFNFTYKMKDWKRNPWFLRDGYP